MNIIDVCYGSYFSKNDIMGLIEGSKLAEQLLLNEYYDILEFIGEKIKKITDVKLSCVLINNHDPSYDVFIIGKNLDSINDDETIKTVKLDVSYVLEKLFNKEIICRWLKYDNDNGRGYWSS